MKKLIAIVLAVASMSSYAGNDNSHANVQPAQITKEQFADAMSVSSVFGAAAVMGYEVGMPFLFVVRVAYCKSTDDCQK